MRTLKSGIFVSDTMKRTYQYLLLIAGLLTFAAVAKAQAPAKKEKRIDGQIVKAQVDDCDTLIIAQLEDVTVTSFRKFNNNEDYQKYLRYRRYATKVYPYAVESIRLYNEVKEESAEWNKRKKRRTMRKMNKELSQEFKDPLKNLTKTQGYILMKMIEKELDIPFYYLVKDLRGGVNATYWATLGAMYGYKFQTGYVVGEDPILDAVLQDFDISHDK